MNRRGHIFCRFENSVKHTYAGLSQMAPFREKQSLDIMKMPRQYRLQRPAMRIKRGNGKRLFAAT